MGNKLACGLSGGRKRPAIDERYLKPTGLYAHHDVDGKKLKKLILDGKLAPCYPGMDCTSPSLEECPICFLHYPSLNRARCCKKGICTECFLQVKTPQTQRPAQCPFCKTPGYAVEFRGARTDAEKKEEQMEQQRVIEAQIRMRKEEEVEEQKRELERIERRAEEAAN
eukprot:CAMPEP_0182912474 /NCGR_PEP_ID=MMETSP0034_2-20130328/37535_1 /TAXON_ID=156128 /ORGANISM="Nephroselmis pyriformis, Strain CCMP717" /LENGTH=167 /DNA_ID=CAMNT_0025049149 /DNA_START=85 /DNA_END=585 /DNA_ORIENTATION=+